jgi:thiamine-phosphate pyrophosphorylase
MLPARLALIADRFTEPDRAERALAAARAGIRWVHLRDHEASLDVFDRAARRLIRELWEVSNAIGISVNTQLNVAVSLGVHVHLGRRGPSVGVARQHVSTDTLIGYSAHDEIEVQGDRSSDADYFFFSPVYPTSSKPDHQGTGVAALESFCTVAHPRPVLALGGITPERIPDCRRAGAYGAAVLSGIMDAAAPQAAARAYLRALASPV